MSFARSGLHTARSTLTRSAARLANVGAALRDAHPGLVPPDAAGASYRQRHLEFHRGLRRSIGGQLSRRRKRLPATLHLLRPHQIERSRRRRVVINRRKGGPSDDVMPAQSRAVRRLIRCALGACGVSSRPAPQARRPLGPVSMRRYPGCAVYPSVQTRATRRPERGPSA